MTNRFRFSSGRVRFRFFAGRAVATLALCSMLLTIGAAARPDRPVELDPDVQNAVNHISADSLKGHLSFIASDLLEGRNTPSRGLDIAAEYISAQFRRAGLEPAGDDGYFQTANWSVQEHNPAGFVFEIRTPKGTSQMAFDRVSWDFPDAFDFSSDSMVKVDFKDAAAWKSLKQQDVEGKAVLSEVLDPRTVDSQHRREAMQSRGEFLSQMSVLKAAVVISVDKSDTPVYQPGRLIDPERPQAAPSRSSGLRALSVHDRALAEAYQAAASGPIPYGLKLHTEDTIDRPVKVRNVAGLLRGSDPALKDTYVLVTAHYDHLGTLGPGEGDRIYNGANDDGSGTVSVIELASALATLKHRPKRSILFMTFFGEEKGLLGSRYYGRHPLFPIAKTVADVNLEQVGRTDSDEGPQVSNATLTGFDFSDMGPIFEAAGKHFGVSIYKHPRNSDAYFPRSDNQALADQGVPAHTLCVAFSYPDYHGLGDSWDKVDYANMEKVDRTVALALLLIADNPKPPEWNRANPKTAKYVTAWEQSHREH